MAESVATYWHDMRLTVYGDEIFEMPAGVKFAHMPAWHDDFKARYRFDKSAHGLVGNESYNFRRDCVKFSHKIAALTDRPQSDYIVWMDIDTIAFNHVTPKMVKSWIKPNTYIAWLDRINLYPECGFMIFDCNHPQHDDFMKKLSALYATGNVLHMAQTHDSYIIEYLIKNMKLPTTSLSGVHRNKHHPMAFCEISKYLDHFKGKRKLLGYSPERVSKGH
jgi:hypothetical protein